MRTGKWIIDPPQGYLFGFPKVWDADKEPSVYKWMVSEGYPQDNVAEIDKYGLVYTMRRFDG